MIPKKKGQPAAKSGASTRVVRRAVVSETRTTIMQEERSHILEIEDEDEDYQPEDPIEDDFPPPRTAATRAKRDYDAEEIVDGPAQAALANFAKLRDEVRTSELLVATNPDADLADCQHRRHQAIKGGERCRVGDDGKPARGWYGS